MPTPQMCTKRLHTSHEEAQRHVGSLIKSGYTKAFAYKCKWCPFFHTTKGEKRGKTRTQPLKYKVQTPKWARKLVDRRPREDDVEQFGT